MQYYLLYHQTKYFLKEKNVLKILNKHTMIIPKRVSLGNYSVKDWYVKCDGKEKDLITTEAVLNELFPEYVESYQRVLQQNEAFYCNMFIMKKTLLDKYCTWLFPILELVESRTDLKNYILLNVFLYHFLFSHF